MSEPGLKRHADWTHYQLYLGKFGFVARCVFIDNGVGQSVNENVYDWVNVSVGAPVFTCVP